MKKALIFYGGWDGHDPVPVSERFCRLLCENGYEVNRCAGMEPLADADYLKSLDLIVPCWTMGEIPSEYCRNVCEAVKSGVGIAGCHGGMCDAFRQSTDWQFMTGGQWVAHPGGDGIDYKVNIIKGSHPIVDGINDFDVCSEQYYLHVDPAVDVLATTRFSLEKPVDMPVVWVKNFGSGRVFYCSVGHKDYLFDKYPEAQEIMLRGMLWAGEGKKNNK